MDSEERYRLIITVEDIRGRCPVFKAGDRITIEPPRIILDQTDNICIHALGCILSMIVPLSRGVNFKDLGLAKEGENGFFQCLDPGEPYTHGGTVLFRIRRRKI
ncbi:MAG: TIGR04076 family protein [Candidatus Bathyarchaeota archaeon]|nr:TIGR04076 family protein [Candidatus Bathyarchaeota archaeon]MCX8177161.1 TIGR04076 family protein [Candidatus Bathyarchaeota archaeon]MDW8193673.1 TIGR04076 family protein [Nitrososphaerota archaeon]